MLSKYYQIIIGKKEKGFSLLEVMIGVFLIVVSLIGVMMLINQSLASGSFGVSRLVAANLAQEGIELVKSVRELSYNTASWDSWYGSVVGSSDYIVQYNDLSLRPFADQPLKYDAATGLYSYDLGEATQAAYKRKVTLAKISDVEVQVICTVSWSEKNKTFSIQAEDRLWNWR